MISHEIKRMMETHPMNENDRYTDPESLGTVIAAYFWLACFIAAIIIAVLTLLSEATNVPAIF